MRTTFRFVDKNGEPLKRVLEPYVDTNATIKTVTYLPALGDPDDPDDQDELLLTVEVDDD